MRAKERMLGLVLTVAVSNSGRCGRRSQAIFRFQQREFSPPRATAGRHPSEQWAFDVRKHVAVSCRGRVHRCELELKQNRSGRCNRREFA